MYLPCQNTNIAQIAVEKAIFLKDYNQNKLWGTEGEVPRTLQNFTLEN